MVSHRPEGGDPRSYQAELLPDLRAWVAADCNFGALGARGPLLKRALEGLIYPRPSNERPPPPAPARRWPQVQRVGDAKHHAYLRGVRSGSGQPLRWRA